MNSFCKPLSLILGMGLSFQFIPAGYGRPCLAPERLQDSMPAVSPGTLNAEAAPQTAGLSEPKTSLYFLKDSGGLSKPAKERVIIHLDLRQVDVSIDTALDEGRVVRSSDGEAMGYYRFDPYTTGPDAGKFLLHIQTGSLNYPYSTSDIYLVDARRENPKLLMRLRALFLVDNNNDRRPLRIDTSLPEWQAAAKSASNPFLLTSQESLKLETLPLFQSEFNDFNERYVNAYLDALETDPRREFGANNLALRELNTGLISYEAQERMVDRIASLWPRILPSTQARMLTFLSSLHGNIRTVEKIGRIFLTPLTQMLRENAGANPGEGFLSVRNFYASALFRSLADPQLKSEIFKLYLEAAAEFPLWTYWSEINGLLNWKETFGISSSESAALRMLVNDHFIRGILKISDMANLTRLTPYLDLSELRVQNKVHAYFDQLITSLQPSSNRFISNRQALDALNLFKFSVSPAERSQMDQIFRYNLLENNYFETLILGLESSDFLGWNILPILDYGLSAEVEDRFMQIFAKRLTLDLEDDGWYGILPRFIHAINTGSKTSLYAKYLEPLLLKRNPRHADESEADYGLRISLTQALWYDQEIFLYDPSLYLFQTYGPLPDAREQIISFFGFIRNFSVDQPGWNHMITLQRAQGYFPPLAYADENTIYLTPGALRTDRIVLSLVLAHEGAHAYEDNISRLTSVRYYSLFYNAKQTYFHEDFPTRYATTNEREFWSDGVMLWHADSRAELRRALENYSRGLTTLLNLYLLVAQEMKPHGAASADYLPLFKTQETTGLSEKEWMHAWWESGSAQSGIFRFVFEGKSYAAHYENFVITSLESLALSPSVQIALSNVYGSVLPEDAEIDQFTEVSPGTSWLVRVRRSFSHEPEAVEIEDVTLKWIHGAWAAERLRGVNSQGRVLKETYFYYAGGTLSRTQEYQHHLDGSSSLKEIFYNQAGRKIREWLNEYSVSRIRTQTELILYYTDTGNILGRTTYQYSISGRLLFYVSKTFSNSMPETLLKHLRVDYQYRGPLLKAILQTSYRPDGTLLSQWLKYVQDPFARLS